jgi:ATP-binding cassette subfamily F protein 3
MFIDRFRYQATKASQVQSRIKMLEKVEPIEVPPERKKIHFDFPTCGKSGRTVLELKNARKAYADHVVFRGANAHIERGDRIALVGPNGAGKSTLMRMLSGEEAPDSGDRIEGPNVVMQYFAQDEATRMDPSPTVYETLASGSPLHMVPAIRNILGGFLFSGDDVHKRVRVLSGGERTRLAVARMLLRPSNVLLLDEPTNHLDLDSKEVLLDALVDYGGTLVFVSHDRYFVERLATKIIEIADGDAVVYPGTYKEFLWRKEHPDELLSKPILAGARQDGQERREGSPRGHAEAAAKQSRGEASTSVRAGDGLPRAAAARGARGEAPAPVQKDRSRGQAKRESHEEKKRADAAARKRQRAAQARRAEIEALETQIADCEAALREVEQTMASPGFYENRDASQPTISRHQELMWQIGDLMHRWEKLQSADDIAGPDKLVI